MKGRICSHAQRTVTVGKDPFMTVITVSFPEFVPLFKSCLLGNNFVICLDKIRAENKHSGDAEVVFVVAVERTGIVNHIKRRPFQNGGIFRYCFNVLMDLPVPRRSQLPRFLPKGLRVGETV
jgi:hypothetical protein